MSVDWLAMTSFVGTVGGGQTTRKRKRTTSDRKAPTAAAKWGRYGDYRFDMAEWATGKISEGNIEANERGKVLRSHSFFSVLGNVTLGEAASGALKIEEMLDEGVKQAAAAGKEMEPLVVRKVSAAELGKGRMDLLWAQYGTPEELQIREQEESKKAKKKKNRRPFSFKRLFVWFSLPRLPVAAPPNTAVTSAELGRYQRDLLFPEKARRSQLMVGVLSTSEAKREMRGRRPPLQLRLLILTSLLVIAAIGVALKFMFFG